MVHLRGFGSRFRQVERYYRALGYLEIKLIVNPIYTAQSPAASLCRIFSIREAQGRRIKFADL